MTEVTDDKVTSNKVTCNLGRNKESEGITMDIKEKIQEVVEKLAKDKDLQEQFKDEPVKVLEKILGVDLPDDIVEKVVDGVKAKIAVDGAADALGALKKLF